MSPFEKPSVCILTYAPLGEAALTPLTNLIELLSANGVDVKLVTGGEVVTRLKKRANLEVFNVKAVDSSNPFLRLIDHASMQLQVLFHLIFSCIKCRVFVLFLGEVLITPLFATKLLGKKLNVMLGITPSKEHFLDGSVFSRFWLLFNNINVKFSKRIIVYSKDIVKGANLSVYQNKIVFAYEHWVDFNQFYIQGDYGKRENIVGYVGRFSQVKGILNFVQAVPLLSKEEKMSFTIAGNGELLSKVKEFVGANKLESKVELAGWVPHGDLPKTLNKLKLLVVPSYSEALPNIVLEAMACGTPVLATSVGAIPEIIQDGETGFLLKYNDPKEIATKISFLVRDPELLRSVSNNAYQWVRVNFDKESNIKNWCRVLVLLQES